MMEAEKYATNIWLRNKVIRFTIKVVDMLIPENGVSMDDKQKAAYHIIDNYIQLLFKAYDLSMSEQADMMSMIEKIIFSSGGGDGENNNK
jgi:hypothetical protein